MLRVKQDKLQELEKFGFRKFYDCDTGELLRYYLYFDNKPEIYLRVDVNNNFSNECYIFDIFEFNLCGFTPKYKKEAINKFIDFVYDLIKADIVEKVVEND